MSTDAAIRVSGIEKSFKEVHVLRGVDFDVARGSIFALLGSNGAGKTTVIRILSTLLKQDAGTANVHGFDVATQAQDVRESISLTGPVRRRRRDPHRTREPRAGRPPPPPQEPRQDRGRPARTLRADRGRQPEGRDLFGWNASQARHRDEPDRRPADHLPRRADDRPRPPGAHRGLADGEGARQRRHHGAAHDAVPRRGGAARRSDRDPPPGSHHRQRHPCRAEAAAAARQGRVHREAAEPRGRVPRAGRRRQRDRRRGHADDARANTKE